MLVFMDIRLDLLLIWFPSRAKDAVAALIKRLAHRNANVQLYTLEVRFILEVVMNMLGTRTD